MNILAAAGLMTLSIAALGLATAQVAEAGSASITSVTFGGTQASPTITVSGSGFGTESDIGTPNSASDTQNCSPATGDDYGTNMYIYDSTDPSYFVAGLGPPNLAAVGVIITTYTDSQIVFTPGSCYGQNGWTFAPGDAFTMNVLGASYSGSVSYPTETTETDWSAPISVDSPNTLESVSCASSSLCVAVDDVGNEVTFNGSTFSSPNPIDEAVLNSVSCPTTNFCVAADDQGATITFNGSSWNGPVPIDSSPILSVSCSSPDFCAAVDQDGNALTYNGSNWSSPESVAEVPLQSVSCTNSSFCVAADTFGSVYTYNGSSWTSPDNIDSSNPLDSVSCPGRISVSQSTPMATP